MPTPFTHLEVAQRLLTDDALPDDLLTHINEHGPAFLLGSVAADARVAAAAGREVTHFYRYDIPITEHPWRVMLNDHPTLQQANSPAHRVFLAGYVAHLAMDEAWNLKLVRPEFVEKEWDKPRAARFLALHLILIHMDERDENHLESWQPATLSQAQPDCWLPFMSDEVLCTWRDFISEQISPDGISQTINIFGERLRIPAQELRTMSQDKDQLQANLWDYVSQATLAHAETAIYYFLREQLCIYWEEFS